MRYSKSAKMKEFYLSRRWRDARLAFILSKFHKCEICGKKIVEKGDLVVHHIDPITEQDVVNFNHKKLVDFDNLQLVCRLCHETIHNRQAKSRFAKMQKL